MLLAVEERVFAMLADALFKQTNKKKKAQGGRNPKQNSIPSNVSVFMKEKHRIVLSSVVKMVCWRGNFVGRSQHEIQFEAILVF